MSFTAKMRWSAYIVHLYSFAEFADLQSYLAYPSGRLLD